MPVQIVRVSPSPSSAVRCYKAFFFINKRSFCFLSCCLLLKLFDDMDTLMLSCFLGVPREEAEDQLSAMDIEHDSSAVALIVAGVVSKREKLPEIQLLVLRLA